MPLYAGNGATEVSTRRTINDVDPVRLTQRRKQTESKIEGVVAIAVWAGITLVKEKRKKDEGAGWTRGRSVIGEGEVQTAPPKERMYSVKHLRELLHFTLL